MTRTTTLRQRFSYRDIASALLLVGVNLGCWPSVALAQDAGAESLKRQRLPWYEPATGDIRPVPLQPRDDPSSVGRASVPQLQPVDNSFWDWLGDLFSGWSWDSSIGSALYWLLWIALAAGLASLVIWVVRNVDARSTNIETTADRNRSRAQSVAQLPFQIDTADDDFRSLAAKACSTGDYRQAIVWLFSHVLISLDQGGMIRLKKGKTNRQYLRELSGRRELSNYYSDVMLPFEASFFGDHEVESHQFQACWDELDQFEKRLDASSGGTA